MSVTMPLTLLPGISIQSSSRTMSFSDMRTPATNPRMVSLNISISTAVKAPSPVMRLSGDLLMRMDMTAMAPMQKTITCNSWMKPFIGRFWSSFLLRSASPAVFRAAFTERITAMQKYIQVILSLRMNQWDCLSNATGRSAEMMSGGMMAVSLRSTP